MLLANNWNDYEVLDTTDGEKLERWGDYVLVRPDPQVIWQTGHGHSGWKQKNAHYHRSKKGGGEWEFLDLPEEWQIAYDLPIHKRLSFHLKPFSFKHTGLFPEQAVNWDFISQSPEPLRLHRRSHSRRCRGRRSCHPCRCIQRHGRMGERKRRSLRIV